MTAVIHAPQTAFANALREPSASPPPGLHAPTAPSVERRFSIYRNNVAVGLIEALETRFPATRRIVGEAFFRAMARLYMRADPPRSPLMMRYGDSLPDFIASFSPAAEAPYLSDVARLEAARTRAYHAADAAPLDADALASLAGADPAALRLRLHPSLELVSSPFPVATIWNANAGEAPPGPIADWSGETAIVARPHFDVEVRRARPGCGAFIAALQAGASLGEAAAVANQDFDLPAAIALVIRAGLAVGAA